MKIEQSIGFTFSFSLKTQANDRSSITYWNVKLGESERNSLLPISKASGSAENSSSSFSDRQNTNPRKFAALYPWDLDGPEGNQKKKT